jgi:hypothetical protein
MASVYKCEATSFGHSGLSRSIWDRYRGSLKTFLSDEKALAARIFLISQEFYGVNGLAAPWDLIGVTARVVGKDKDKKKCSRKDLQSRISNE